MRYLMKQKLFSFGDDFIIKDEAGNDVFYVDGKVWSIGQKLIFQDMQGNELARIEQRLLSWGPTYEIHYAGGTAVMKKHLFTLLRAAFSIDVPGPGDIEAQGNFTDHEYSFTRGNQQIADVSKRWFTLRDVYGVDIAAGENDVLILACTVVIDMCCHKDHKDE